MAYENILLDQPEPGIRLLTINRPKALNALNVQTLDEIAHAVADIAADTAARVLLVTGAGEKAFVAGADISGMVAMSAIEAEAFSRRGMQVAAAIEALPVPVLALVNGYALGGGCELAMACDWIVASEKAVFGQPEVNLGIPAGFGGTQRLPRLVGRGMAMELLTTGRQVKADEALRIGLANHVVPPDQLMAKGLELARMVAGKAPIAVRMTKQAAHRGLDMDLANGCALENSLFAVAFGTADRKEGMTAFLERRPAKFEGR